MRILSQWEGLGGPYSHKSLTQPGLIQFWKLLFSLNLSGVNELLYLGERF